MQIEPPFTPEQIKFLKLFILEAIKEIADKIELTPEEYETYQALKS